VSSTKILEVSITIFKHWLTITQHLNAIDIIMICCHQRSVKSQKMSLKTQRHWTSTTQTVFHKYQKILHNVVEDREQLLYTAVTLNCQQTVYLFITVKW